MSAPVDSKAFVSQSISMPEDLLELARAKAKAERRSLSNYIQILVAKDLEQQDQEAPRAD